MTNCLHQVDLDEQSGALPKEVADLTRPFFSSYLEAVEDKKVADALLLQYLTSIREQTATPYSFPSYHRRFLEPVNFYQFGIDFISPLIDQERSTLKGTEVLDRIQQQMESGENVVLFGNHQTEPDPQVLSVQLGERYPKLAEEMIFVAGSRVTTDPLAIPFSIGRNLLCIYSKRHIDHPPEEKAEKLRHNQRTMKKMAELLSKGGQCIYVAPSGGRDRLGPEGRPQLAPFDASSIGMFLLMAQQAARPTHFYPLALQTYDVMPPPPKVESSFGELRSVNRTPVHLAFGDELDLDKFPGSESGNKKERRQALATHIFNKMSALYKEISH